MTRFLLFFAIGYRHVFCVWYSAMLYYFKENVNRVLLFSFFGFLVFIFYKVSFFIIDLSVIFFWVLTSLWQTPLNTQPVLLTVLYRWLHVRESYVCEIAQKLKSVFAFFVIFCQRNRFLPASDGVLYRFATVTCTGISFSPLLPAWCVLCKAFSFSI